MKNSFTIFTIFIFIFSINNIFAQTMKSTADAKMIQLKKNQFIGKPLSYLLQNIDIEIKSIIPTPNKKPNEINRISFLFVSKSEYKNSRGNVAEKPTRLTVIFNQNWGLEGERCTYDKPNCSEFNKTDEKNLGNLIIHDIFVSGKN